MSIRMIAMDLDGTLLNGEKNIAPRDAAAVQKAIAAGYYVTLATGRMYCSALPYARELGISHPLVVYNGALIKDPVSGKELARWSLDRKMAQQVVDLCLSQGIYIQAYINDTLWCCKDCEEVRYYSRFARVPYQVVGEALHHLPDAPHKLLAVTEQVTELKQKLETAFPGKLRLVSSSKGFLEIISPEVGKWRALQALARKEKIRDDEILCVGDSDNDVDMVKNCGIGVAMGNANDNVRRAAQIVTASNEKQGVALVLRQILTEQVQVPET